MPHQKRNPAVQDGESEFVLAGRFDDSEHTISAHPGEVLIKKNTRESLRLALDVFKGYRLLTARIFFQPPDGGPIRPGRDGWAICIDTIPDVIAALQQIQTEAIERGWLQPTKGAGLIPCTACGVLFQPKRKDQHHCSSSCRQRAKRNRNVAQSVTSPNTNRDQAGFDCEGGG